MSIFLSEENLILNSDYFYTSNVHYDIFMPSGKIPKLSTDTMKENSLIYCWTNVLAFFVENDMPKIRVKFSLILGLSDLVLPYLSHSDKKYTWAHFNKLITYPYLVSIYAVSTDIEHSKIKPILLGLCRSIPVPNTEYKYMEWYQGFYNSIAVKNYFKPFESTNPLELMRSKLNQNNKLIHIRYTLCNTDNCHILRYKNFRRKLQKYLSEKGFIVQTNLISWQEYMKEMVEYKFSLHPHGACASGFRICEAILTGVIPVVFNSYVCEAYSDLPVLIIDNFEQINESFLNQKYREIISRNDYNFQKLTTKYWISKMREEF